MTLRRARSPDLVADQLDAFSGWQVVIRHADRDDGQAAAETVLWKDADGPLTISRIDEIGIPRHRLRLADQVAVDVFPGRMIVAKSPAGVARATVDHFLADQVLPRVLAHSGKLVIHAGSVRFGDEALVFMGPSGRGKSTLVASLDRAGLALLGDDAMVLSTVDGVPQVQPVYPSLRLFPDSIAALMPGASTTGPVAHYSTKERIDLGFADVGAASPLPIRALFAIAAVDEHRAIGLRRLSVAQACMALVESSFALDPTDLVRARDRLKQASALAGAVPAFELSYPRDFACLAEVRRAIVERLQNAL